MDFLKKFFNGKSLTFEEFSEALKADEDIELVNLNEGKYVSKGEYDKANETIENLRNTVKKFDGVDVGKLKNDVSNWEKKYNEDLTALRMDYAVENALNSAGSRNNKAVKALLSDFLKNAKLDEEGTVSGLFDEIKKLSEAEESSFMFKSAEEREFSGTKPGNSGGDTHLRHNEQDVSKMSYSEFLDYQTTHPEAKY